MFRMNRFVHELPELLDLQEKPAQIETDFPNTLLVLTDLRNCDCEYSSSLELPETTRRSESNIPSGTQQIRKKRSARQNLHIPRIPVGDKR